MGQAPPGRGPWSGTGASTAVPWSMCGALPRTTTGSTDAYYQADVAFHRALMELAGEPLLTRTAEVHRILTTSLAPGLYRDPHETYPEHLAITEALAAGDADRAEELARSHIRAAVANIRDGTVIVPAADPS